MKIELSRIKTQLMFCKPPGPKGTKQPNSNKILAGHIPIELSCLLNNFLCANTDNNLFAKVTGKRKREIGLVVPERFSAVTTELQVLERQPL